MGPAFGTGGCATRAAAAAATRTTVRGFDNRVENGRSAHLILTIRAAGHSSVSVIEERIKRRATAEQGRKMVISRVPTNDLFYDRSPNGH